MSDQKVTEKLADNFPEIISNSTYDHSTAESGKETYSHRGVTVWYYFANRIGFINERQNYAEYNVYVDVKEKSEGDYVYSFAAIKQKGSERTKAPNLYSDPKTINASVNGLKPAIANTSIAPSDGSVKYSLRENDRKYMDAVEDGDTQKAQAMVDEAARQAGYTRKLYHGTPNQFNQFMRGGEGIHLGTFEAADFVRRTTVKGENQGRMIEAYVRLENPMYVPYDIQRWNVEKLRDLIFAANGLQTFKELLATTADGQQIDIDFSQVEGIPQITKKAPRPARNIQVDEDFGMSRRKTRRGAAVQTEQVTTRETNRVLSDEEQLSRMKTFDEIAEWLKARGIDGIEYTNAIEDKNSTSVLVFDSNQVKLADAVTYDDQGDVIPLSERLRQGQ